MPSVECMQIEFHEIGDCYEDNFHSGLAKCIRSYRWEDSRLDRQGFQVPPIRYEVAFRHGRPKTLECAAILLLYFICLFVQSGVNAQTTLPDEKLSKELLQMLSQGSVGPYPLFDASIVDPRTQEAAYNNWHQHPHLRAILNVLGHVESISPQQHSDAATSSNTFVPIFPVIAAGANKAGKSHTLSELVKTALKDLASFLNVDVSTLRPAAFKVEHLPVATTFGVDWIMVPRVAPDGSKEEGVWLFLDVEGTARGDDTRHHEGLNVLVQMLGGRLLFIAKSLQLNELQPLGEAIMARMQAKDEIQPPDAAIDNTLPDLAVVYSLGNLALNLATDISKSHHHMLTQRSTTPSKNSLIATIVETYPTNTAFALCSPQNNPSIYAEGVSRLWAYLVQRARLDTRIRIDGPAWQLLLDRIVEQLQLNTQYVQPPMEAIALLMLNRKSSAARSQFDQSRAMHQSNGLPMPLTLSAIRSSIIPWKFPIESELQKLARDAIVRFQDLASDYKQVWRTLVNSVLSDLESNLQTSIRQLMTAYFDWSRLPMKNEIIIGPAIRSSDRLLVPGSLEMYQKRSCQRDWREVLCHLQTRAMFLRTTFNDGTIEDGVTVPYSEQWVDCQLHKWTLRHRAVFCFGSNRHSESTQPTTDRPERIHQNQLDVLNAQKDRADARRVDQPPSPYHDEL